MIELQRTITSFRTDGFALLDQLWTPDETAEIETEMERFLVDCVPSMQKPHKVFTDGREGEVKNLGSIDKYDPYFRELSNHRPMSEIASALLGEEAIFLAFEYFSRPPRSEAVGPYHQDNGYFCYEPPEALAFWIPPLDDVDQENGGVVYARGSHNAGLLPHTASGIHGFSQRLVDAEKQLEGYDEVVGVLPRGGCAIHDCLTAHRSGPNKTARRRRAIVADYRTANAVESKPLRRKLERDRDELLKKVRDA